MSMITYDRATMDSLGTFFTGELQRLDPKLYEPLHSVSWGRDINLRSDVVLADASTGFMRANFGAFGSGDSNVSWSSKKANSAKDVSLDAELKTAPLRDVDYRLSYSIRELAASQMLGRPIDAAKFSVLQLKYQLDLDQVVYIGDTVMGFKGLLNHGDVTLANVSNGAQGASTWDKKTPEEIRDDINKILFASWEASAYTIAPHQLLLPPAQYAYIATTPFNNFSEKTIMDYLRDSCLSTQKNGEVLEINPVKWLSGVGSGNKNRMVAYSKNEGFVRYPLVPLSQTPVEQHGTEFSTVYYGTLGELEIIYPSTLIYADGI